MPENNVQGQIWPWLWRVLVKPSLSGTVDLSFSCTLEWPGMLSQNWCSIPPLTNKVRISEGEAEVSVHFKYSLDDPMNSQAYKPALILNLHKGKHLMCVENCSTEHSAALHQAIIMEWCFPAQTYHYYIWFELILLFIQPKKNYV